MIRILLKLICPVLVFLYASGCAPTVTGQSYELDSANQYRYLNDDLHKSIRVVWARTEVTDGGHRQALIYVQNLRSRPETVSYRVQWFDQLGNPIVQNNLWRYHDIAGSDHAFLTEVATSLTAYRYQVTFTANTSNVRRTNPEKRSDNQHEDMY